MRRPTMRRVGRVRPELVVGRLKQFFTQGKDGKLVQMDVKTYKEAIKHEGTVWATIPKGLIHRWIIKDAGKVFYGPNYPVDFVRRSM